MNTSLIKKKERLTHERILHDLKMKPMDIGSWILSWILLAVLIMLLVLERYDPLLVIGMSLCILCGFWTFLYVSRILYHDICTKNGGYRIESATLTRVRKGRHSQNYALYFSNKKHFIVHEKQRYYTWSSERSLSSYGVAKVYAECGDAFNLVMHGRQIVMVYNMNLFEWET